MQRRLRPRQALGAGFEGPQPIEEERVRQLRCDRGVSSCLVPRDGHGDAKMSPEPHAAGDVERNTRRNIVRRVEARGLAVQIEVHRRIEVVRRDEATDGRADEAAFAWRPAAAYGLTALSFGARHEGQYRDEREQRDSSQHQLTPTAVHARSSCV